MTQATGTRTSLKNDYLLGGARRRLVMICKGTS